MANKVLQYGARGDEVRKLQQILNQQGYGLDIDGSFGPKTLAAVKAYQKNKGLAVDGSVGPATWGALTTVSNGASTNPAATATPSAPTELQQWEQQKPGEYQQSDTVKAAEEALKQWQQNKPGEYQSNYQEQIEALLSQVLNGEKFQYDFNADPMYQQYKDQYTQQGKMAMLDTTAQAAAMSGGYGNSYAATAGNQAYQAYLGQLNNVIPQLAQNAYTQYQDNRNTQYQNLSTLQGLEQSDYQRYQDALNDYYTNLNFKYNQYNTEYDRDYGQHRDSVTDWTTGRDYLYGKEQDALTQANWEKELAYQKERDAIADKQWQQQYALQQAQAAASKARSSSSSSKKSGYSYDYNSTVKTLSSMVSNGNTSGALSMLADLYNTSSDLSIDDLERMAIAAGISSSRFDSYFSGKKSAKVVTPSSNSKNAVGMPNGPVFIPRNLK